jgi:hypothetical protein
LLTFALVSLPACDKIKGKAKEAMARDKCERGRKALATCFPKEYKKVDKTAQEQDAECIKNIEEKVTHRIETLDCILAAKENCADVEKCIKKGMKAEMEYRSAQKKDRP